MKLIAGLGNPGLRYRSTRHNIGFMVIDKLASRYGIRIKDKLFQSLCGNGRIEGADVILVKPLTYMNLSGKAIIEIMKKKDISSEDILIIVDDADLELGRIRLRSKGSSGGHNGLRSIIEESGTEDIMRLRVGVGSQGRSGELRNYVLSPFKRAERGPLTDTIERSCLCVKAWVEVGASIAMTRFNS